MFQYLLICQIGTRLNVCVHHLGFPFHERVQYILECSHIRRYRTCAVLVPCDGYKSVRCSRKIHFQPMRPIIDVINRLIKNEIRIHMEEPTKSAAGRGTFKVCIFKNSQYGSRHVI